MLVDDLAEVSGYDIALTGRRRRTLEYTLRSLFPDVGDLNQAIFWARLRAMTRLAPR